MKKNFRDWKTFINEYRNVMQRKILKLSVEIPESYIPVGENKNIMDETNAILSFKIFLTDKNKRRTENKLIAN